MSTERERERNRSDAEQRRESGRPGGGQGRVDEVGRSGVYPASGPLPEGDAEIRAPASWGQGERGAEGYADHGESELNIGEDWMRGAPEKCRDVMTKDPICAVPGDTVDRVAQMLRAEDVGSLPVIDDQQQRRLVGMVTDRDLVVRVIAEGRDPKQTRVGDVMTRDLVACGPDDDLRRALDVMATYQVRRVPIVDDNGRVVGIIAQADIATRMEAPRRTAEVVEEISQPNTPEG